MLPKLRSHHCEITFAAPAAATSASAPALGPLPEWNLADLYPAMDSALFAADIAKATTECKAFSDTYKGTLTGLAADPTSGGSLAEAVKRYEALEELMERIMSYASLVYSGDTSDPARGKFYGDAQEKITSASTDLLFFELELNRPTTRSSIASPPLCSSASSPGPAG